MTGHPSPMKKSKKMSTNKKGKAGSLDEHIGSRLKQRRSLLGMTQENLAESVGITFQQIQKYENGANRISAGRLFEFSKILNIPIGFFFENYLGQQNAAMGLSDNEQDPLSPDPLVKKDVLQEKETLELIRVYYSIKSPKLRKDLFSFVKSMAENLKAQDK